MSLAKFLARRTLQGLVVIWGVVTATFLIRAVAPGDPVAVILGPGASEAVQEQVRDDLGLDEPLPLQYVEFLQGLVVGDLGYSYQSRREVEIMVLERVPATLELAIAATIVAIVIAIPLGVVSATRRNEPADYGATTFSLVGISTPNFWLGIMLILLFAVQWGLLPSSGRSVGLDEALVTLVTTGTVGDLLTWIRHIILPAITLGTFFTALITRLTRSGMVDELGKPYVTAAEAKGLPGVLIRYKHVLRNTMIPIITVLGLQLGTLIGGAVITEEVFNWPGLGSRLISSIRSNDWPLTQGILIFIAVGFVVINIVVDAVYAYLNPRVTAE
ncbi:ABC transporter permease [Natrarchaeobaculum sulfurireducens]|uniref:Dipeptide transport system permease protein DppB n=1 Tax=Natrarchaeobaculum sulfurireducens TaxID=2044521 RepID=A0A346PRX5_9EURY|nr:ABC transporter permease [Natrarchaeobaculum sulfurireducens]AXR82270.1 Dipeptide transport system permease protein DppB [Natrarchaeobaculum sulfurireducens]